MGVAGFAAVIGAAAAGYGAYEQNQASNAQNKAAEQGASAIENAQNNQDAATQTQLTQNYNTQKQDAQWMQMRSLANGGQQDGAPAPGGLLQIQQANPGAKAGANAGALPR